MICTENNYSNISIFASAVSDRSFYIRLKDNRLVLIDMGCVNLLKPQILDAELFKKFVKELQSVCGSEVIRVAALFITHPHGDHVNFLEQLKATGLDKYFVIEKIIRKFPPKDWVPQNNWEQPDYPEKIENILQNMSGTEIITPNRLDIFEFGDVRFEILLTADDAPENAKDSNYFSMLIKQSVGEKTILWTGDMSDSLGEKALLLYGDYLKCDILQVPHHGTPNCGTMEFFKTADANLHIWNIAKKTFLNPDYMFAYGKYTIPTEIYNMSVPKIFCGENLTEIKI